MAEVMQSVVIQLPISIENRLGTSDELEHRHEIERALGELLEARDLGVCDGGDIGGGTMNVFLYHVSDVPAVVSLSVECLRSNGWLTEGCLIAAGRADERLKIVWPDGASGEFDFWGMPSVETVM
jgi:hypothetical protein